MSFSALIDDGYTLSFTIPARPGLHPEIKGEYRPALFAKRLEFLRRDNQESGEKAKWCAQVLAEHVQRWNVMDSKGQMASCTVENIIRLVPAAFDSLIGIVFGYSPGEQEEDQKN